MARLAPMTDAELARTVYAPRRARRAWTTTDFAGHARLRVYSLARWALVDALTLAGARGRKVLLPDFICREVLASLALAGAEPEFYPVSRDLKLAADPDDLPQAAAIVAVDYFGFAQDLAPFERYSRRTGATLIEDNAHGLLSHDDAGRPLGARAPLGLLSMRKTLALPDGGALLVNDEALWERAPAQAPAAARPAAGLSFMRRRRAARALAPWVGARAMAAGIRGGRRVRKLLTGSELPPPDLEAEQEIGAAAAPSAEALEPFTCADAQAEVERRRALYALCQKLLRPAAVEPVFRELAPRAAPYVYAYRAEPGQGDRAEALLRANGLFSLPWPALPDVVAARAPFYHSLVRGVQFLW